MPLGSHFTGAALSWIVTPPCTHVSSLLDSTATVSRLTFSFLDLSIRPPDNGFALAPERSDLDEIPA
jgi:hypothetical protein